MPAATRSRSRRELIWTMLGEAELSPTQIAKFLAVPKSTVFTIEARRRAKALPSDAIQFRRVAGKVCPVHGAVTVWPCVACAATAAKVAKKGG